MATAKIKATADCVRIIFTADSFHWELTTPSKAQSPFFVETETVLRKSAGQVSFVLR